MVLDAQGNELFPPLLGNQSVVDGVIERLTDALIAGKLKPGQKIPTEMELCESLQVGRNSVREAIKVLSAMGVLEIRRPEGTFVCKGFSNRMLDPMVYGMILEGNDPSKIIELRKLFDIGILEMLTEKSNAQIVQKLREALEEFRRVVQASDDEAEIQDADIRFHMAMESCVDNTLVDKLSFVITRLTRPTRLLATRRFLNKNQKDELIQLHQNLLDIIETRDAAQISSAIDKHFKYWSHATR